MTEVATTLRSCYLAGPMRGYEHYNFPAFHKAAAWLRAGGWDVFSPAERDEQDEALSSEAGWADGKTLDYFMQFDLPAVCRQDTVVCLPDWEDSQGSRLETMVAVELDHPVFEITSTKKGRRKLRHVNPDYVRLVFAQRSLRVEEWKVEAGEVTF